MTFSPGVPLGVEPPDDDKESLIASEDGVEIGFAVWRVEHAIATVDVVASVSDDDRDADVLAALRARAVDLGVTAMTVEVGANQPGLQELLQDAPVLSRFMVKPVPEEPPALPGGFAARAMTAADYAVWKQRAIDGYTTANLARCGGDLDLARKRSVESFDRYLPDGPDTADTRLLTLTQEHAPVGYLWLRHHRPRYRDAAPADDQTFTFDVEVAPDRRGEGLGRAAMLAAERCAVEAGDGQLGLNVFGDNEVAGGLYTSLGYATRSTVLDVAVR